MTLTQEHRSQGRRFTTRLGLRNAYAPTLEGSRLERFLFRAKSHSATDSEIMEASLIVSIHRIQAAIDTDFIIGYLED